MTVPRRSRHPPASVPPLPAPSAVSGTATAFQGRGTRRPFPFRTTASTAPSLSGASSSPPRPLPGASPTRPRPFPARSSPNQPLSDARQRDVGLLVGPHRGHLFGPALLPGGEAHRGDGDGEGPGAASELTVSTVFGSPCGRGSWRPGKGRGRLGHGPGRLWPCPRRPRVQGSGVGNRLHAHITHTAARDWRKDRGRVTEASRDRHRRESSSHRRLELHSSSRLLPALQTRCVS